MSNLMKKYGGLILFYTIILMSILLLNARFRYLKQLQESTNQKTTTITLKEENKNV